MTSAVKQSDRQSDRQGDGRESRLSIDDLVLLRITAGGAKRADLQRDLAPLVAPRMSGTEFRRGAELAISALVGKQYASEARGRLTATGIGRNAISGRIGSLHARDFGTQSSWTDVRDVLSLAALDLAPTPAMTRALQRPDGLAGLVLQHHFKVLPGKILSPVNLRAALAIVALERAFGNKIKTGLGTGSGLPAKAGRLLAGQLFKSPREFSTDGKLITALAADVLGMAESSVDAMKTALIRRLTSTREDVEVPARAPIRRSRSPALRPDNDSAPSTLVGPIPPAPAAIPPDMTEFCRAVLDVARPVSEGWPGNRKAFISLVWKAIRHNRPDWGLSEIAFKGMLAEAHRTGRVELVGADLKDSRDLKALEDSKILYKNTVWHFVRVED